MLGSLGRGSRADKTLQCHEVADSSTHLTQYLQVTTHGLAAAVEIYMYLVSDLEPKAGQVDYLEVYSNY